MNTIETTQQTDPREVYFTSAAWVSGLLTGVRADQLDLPTPCDEFDVRTLRASRCHGPKADCDRRTRESGLCVALVLRS